MSFLKWAKQVLFRPKHFFTVEEKKIKGWGHPIRYLVIFTLFATVFTTFEQFRNIKELTTPILEKLGLDPSLFVLQLSLQNFIMLYLILAITAIFSSFFRYWVIHWFVKLYNPKTTYQQTYKTLAFSTTPGWIGMPFAVIASFLFYFSVTQKELVYWILFMVFIVITLIIEAYSIYVRTVAIATTNKIHWFKSFIAIYVFGGITFFALLFVVVSVLTVLAFAIMNLFSF